MANLRSKNIYVFKVKISLKTDEQIQIIDELKLSILNMNCWTYICYGTRFNTCKTGTILPDVGTPHNIIDTRYTHIQKRCTVLIWKKKLYFNIINVGRYYTFVDISIIPLIIGKYTSIQFIKKRLKKRSLNKIIIVLISPIPNT